MLVVRLSGHQVYPVIRSSGHPVIRSSKPTGHAKRPDMQNDRISCYPVKIRPDKQTNRTGTATGLRNLTSYAYHLTI